MLTVLSPAKDLDFTALPADLAARSPLSHPRLAAQTAELIELAKHLTVADIARLMDLSPALAELNYARFQAMGGPLHSAPSSIKQAIFAFNGDVYQGLQALSLSSAAREAARSRLRILSGLYGVLRPFDGIEPYRLEMGTRLKTLQGIGLYRFWGRTLAEQLNADAQAAGTDILLNLASQEYFGAVDTAALKLRLVTLHFRDVKDGVSRVVSFYAKQARGAATRHVLEAAIDRPEGLKDLPVAGYEFAASQSTQDDWVFERPQPEPASALQRAKGGKTSGVQEEQPHTVEA